MPINWRRNWSPLLAGGLALAFVSSIIGVDPNTFAGLIFAGFGLFLLISRKKLARRVHQNGMQSPFSLIRTTSRFAEEQLGIDEQAIERIYLYVGLVFALGGLLMTYVSQ